MASVLAASLALAACYSPDATIATGEMSEEDTATYLALTDQLQRVRNVLKKPARVCLGLLPRGTWRGLDLVPQRIVERLKREQSTIEPRLELTADISCLAYYVQDKGPFTPDASDILAYAGTHEPSSYLNHCGKWFGGLYSPGSLDRQVGYDIKVEGGISELTGGEDCSPIRWYRS